MGRSGSGSGAIDQISTCSNLDRGVLSWLGNHTNYGVVCSLKGRKLFRGKLWVLFLYKHQSFQFPCYLACYFRDSGYLEGVLGLFHQPDHGASVIKKNTRRPRYKMNF